MPTIKNQNDLENILMWQMRLAVEEMQNQVYDVIQDFIRAYYTEPVFRNIPPEIPVLYYRTYDFFKSITKSKIVKTSNGWKCEVYIDFDSFSGYVEHSPYEVVDMINRGFHADTSMNQGHYQTPYDIPSKYHFWDDSIDYLSRGNRIIDIFVDYLKSHGIPIK